MLLPGTMRMDAALTVEEEVAMLEAQKTRMQVMIDMINRRIESLKKRA